MENLARVVFRVGLLFPVREPELSGWLHQGHTPSRWERLALTKTSQLVVPQIIRLDLPAPVDLM